MLAIEVELLTDIYVAMAYNDRAAAEWPPHPSRLFSALVATWAEDDGTAEERSALEWLERQPAPAIRASEAFPRTVAPVFVPVNDVQVVSEPTRQRAKVEEAERALPEAPERSKGREKAEKTLETAREKLLADSKKAAQAGKVTAEGMRSARAVLPSSRLRQPRTFPAVVPHRADVVFEWSDTPPERELGGLEQLCRRMIRLGHSSSLVRARVRTEPRLEEGETREPHVPDDDGELVLRVPAEGQLERLVEAHAMHRGVEPRILPSAFARYRLGAPARASSPASTFSSDWFVFERVDGDRFPVVRAADVGTTLRKTLIRFADEPVAEVISGHREEGAPSTEPHAAFPALPFVASPYANGDLLGVAVVPPRGASADARRAIARAIGRWEAEARSAQGEPDEEAPLLELRLGRQGVLVVRRVTFGEAGRTTLRPRTWAQRSRLWATATPIALDRNPGDLHARDPAKRSRAFEEAEAVVMKACENIGLPRPESVDVLRSATLPGTAKPRAHPPFPPAPGKTRRVLVHAKIVFSEPVTGPVLVGAGRYVGLGLCRPVEVNER